MQRTDRDEHRAWVYAYKSAEQFVRGMYVMKDGWGRWWDVAEEPADLISYTKIDDWNRVSEAHRTAYHRLLQILPEFDLHATEHDAPGTPPGPQAPAKKRKKAR